MNKGAIIGISVIVVLGISIGGYFIFRKKPVARSVEKSGSGSGTGGKNSSSGIVTGDFLVELGGQPPRPMYLVKSNGHKYSIKNPEEFKQITGVDMSTRSYTDWAKTNLKEVSKSVLTSILTDSTK